VHWRIVSHTAPHGSPTWLLDAVEDHVETAFELLGVVVAGSGQLVDDFDQVGELLGQGRVRAG
jgi:hypothetical protein